MFLDGELSVIGLEFRTVNNVVDIFFVSCAHTFMMAVESPWLLTVYRAAPHSASIIVR